MYMYHHAINRQIYHLDSIAYETFDKLRPLYINYKLEYITKKILSRKRMNQCRDYTGTRLSFGTPYQQEGYGPKYGS